ncbi:oligopeptide/dipeptide ABC transporter ATP-binding protein [Falsiroseomonas stagni]|uniref:Peptide/nickel transport system ATP-binding protein n=1 Tax=Falsiroseomonas stagni DSM 19981 TaxID=1123062 RepID=A0A1I3ZC71_9PROT|nr:oligopeptide/dipeptide ABC transporter ATP-binding protein [Falsiroseomonas stagni]SFK41704.1 peptide/nickel transport system ATP-binding protein [Falsiroseomonas stagni DSM 19981]
MTAPLVVADAVEMSFAPRGIMARGRPVRAVAGVDATVAAGEALGVVGESGSGKSTLGRLLLGLLAATGGSVRFDGEALPKPGSAAWRRLRARMGLVFQDPFGSLDARRSVGAQVMDGLTIHGTLSGPEREAKVAEMFRRVGLDPTRMGAYPHEFSGGQRQRLGIARALATSPDFLVADEPVSALDVSIQAQVVRLLADLRGDLGLAMLFISHDLPVVRHLCDRVIVMYLGRVMEEGPVAQVFARPLHPYTVALLSATPMLDPARRAKRVILPGEPPSPSNPPSGCVFRTRCLHARPACAEAVPPLRSLDQSGHRVACIRAEEIG